MVAAAWTLLRASMDMVASFPSWQALANSREQLLCLLHGGLPIAGDVRSEPGELFGRAEPGLESLGDGVQLDLRCHAATPNTARPSTGPRNVTWRATLGIASVGGGSSTACAHAPTSTPAQSTHRASTGRSCE